MSESSKKPVVRATGFSFGLKRSRKPFGGTGRKIRPTSHAAAGERLRGKETRNPVGTKPTGLHPKQKSTGVDRHRYFNSLHRCRATVNNAGAARNPKFGPVGRIEI